MIRTTYKEAKRIYGEKLLIGALGLIEEGPEKFRLIHDGTHRILMNNRVRELGQVSSPMVNDLAAELPEIEEERKKHLGPSLDFEGAHRLILVAEDDWGLQAYTEEDLGSEAPSDETSVILHTVGTFGVSTAGVAWGLRSRGLVITYWATTWPLGSHYLPAMARPRSRWKT